MEEGGSFGQDSLVKSLLINEERERDRKRLTRVPWKKVKALIFLRKRYQKIRGPRYFISVLHPLQFSSQELGKNVQDLQADAFRESFELTEKKKGGGGMIIFRGKNISVSVVTRRTADFFLSALRNKVDIKKPGGGRKGKKSQYRTINWVYLRE